MDIVWRRQADRDFDHLFDFVLQHHPSAARHLCDRIQRLVAQLRDHPHMGHRAGSPVPASSSGTPYIVVYRVAAPQIDILAVIHAARRWPAFFAG